MIASWTITEKDNEMQVDCGWKALN
jgi:hypothetical protein